MPVDKNIAEFHLFKRFGKNILFNVETMLSYEVAPVVFDLLTLLADPGKEDPVQSLKSRYSQDEIQEAVGTLMAEGFLKPAAPGAPPPGARPVKRWGIRHLELMLTHDCNMRCRYCYGALGDEEWGRSPYLYGSSTRGMPFETARKGVDYLFEASGPRKDLSVIFFGGEPLLALGVMRRIVPYIRNKEAYTGKRVELSLSTNGLLLTDSVIDFLEENRIGCQVSMDGPPEIHDRTRCLPDGSGSHGRVLPGVKRLIARRRGRVPARATVSHGLVDLPAVVDHLLSLGFGSVHLEPAIGTTGDLMATRDDIEVMKRQNEALALFLVKKVKRNEYFNYANLVRFIRHTRVVRERQAHHCGAGRTYFALSQEGAFYPCHRFVGMEEFRMGDVDAGMDPTLRDRIVNLTVDDRPVCRECWARYLCGGGCWKHAVDMNGRLEMPERDLSCEITRHLVECAMAINSELKVEDRDILSDLYEKAAEPYLVAESEEEGCDAKRDGQQGPGEKGVSSLAV